MGLLRDHGVELSRCKRPEGGTGPFRKPPLEHPQGIDLPVVRQVGVGQELLDEEPDLSAALRRIGDLQYPPVRAESHSLIG